MVRETGEAMVDVTAKELVAVNHGALTLAQYGQLAEVGDVWRAFELARFQASARLISVREGMRCN